VDLPHASAKKQELVQQLLQPEASHPRPVFIGADLSRVSLDQALLEPAYASSNAAGAPLLYLQVKRQVSPLTYLTQAYTASVKSCSSHSSAVLLHLLAAAGAAAAFDPTQPTSRSVEGFTPQAVLCSTAALLAAAGAAAAFDPTQPTLFTVEGLIYYLPTAAVQQLFASLLRVAAPGSRVAFDFLHKQVGLHDVRLM
jgi:hypothetical protein